MAASLLQISSMSGVINCNMLVNTFYLVTQGCFTTFLHSLSAFNIYKHFTIS